MWNGMSGRGTVLYLSSQVLSSKQNGHARRHKAKTRRVALAISAILRVRFAPRCLDFRQIKSRQLFPSSARSDCILVVVVSEQWAGRFSSSWFEAGHWYRDRAWLWLWVAVCTALSESVNLVRHFPRPLPSRFTLDMLL
jgi:hypothetical protein